MRETLLYIASQEIERYIAEHPIYWHDKQLACRGGTGDRAGVPPTAMVYEFLSLLKKKQSLFTQTEFRDHCFEGWGDWSSLSVSWYRQGVEAKLYRNVYPAMIDSLHVWALLVEAGWFHSCMLDSFTDAVSKHDLIVTRDGTPPVAIDIFAGSSSSVNDRQYKQKYRQSCSGLTCPVYEVALSMQRPVKRPGNKRWYCLKDFERVYASVAHENSLWETPIVPCTCGYHVKGKMAG